MAGEPRAEIIFLMAIIISVLIWNLGGIPMYIPLWISTAITFIVAWRTERDIPSTRKERVPFFHATGFLILISVVVTLIYVVHAIMG